MNCKHFLFSLVFSALCSSNLLVAQTEGNWMHYRNPGKVNAVVEYGDDFFMATNFGVARVNRMTQTTDFYSRAGNDLPSEHVADITLGVNGKPWIGTYDVLMLRWNGTEFVPEPLPADIATAMVGKNLYCLETAPDGSIWAGTSNGVLFRDPSGVWTHYPPAFFEYLDMQFASGMQDVWKIVFDNAGNTFMAGNSLVRKDANGVFTDETGEGFNNTLFAYGSPTLLGHDNYVYCITDVGIAGIFNQGQLVEIGPVGDIIPDLPFASNVTSCDAPNTNPTIFDLNNGVFECVDGEFQLIESPLFDYLSFKTHQLLTDSDNNYWAISFDLLYRMNANGTVDSFKINQYSAPSNSLVGIADLAEDKVIAVFGSPLYGGNATAQQYDYTTGIWSDMDPLPGTGTTRFEQETSGQVWIARGSSIYKYNGNTASWDDMSAMTNMPSSINDFIHLSVSGDHIWLAGNYKVHHYNGISWSTLTSTNSDLFYQGYINTIQAMPNGGCLVSQYNYGEQVYYLHEVSAAAAFISTMMSDIMPGLYYFNAIEVNQIGEVFAGTYTGALKRNVAGNWSAIENITADMGVQAIYANYPGHVLFGTFADGLIDINTTDNTAEQFLTTNSELADSFVYLPYRDLNNTTWFGFSDKGLDAYNPAGFTVVGTNNFVKSKAELLVVSPNPTVDFTNLTWKTDVAGSAQMTISNLQGQIIKSESIHSQIGVNNRLISLQNLPVGTYTISVTTTDHVVRAAQAIKW
jgi:ligand-binding sensor domain-containing protein